jgi:heme-degrading monooxygenase HmoA
VIAVIFELQPTTERRDEYLAIAASLKPLLECVDGFVSIERFQSLSHHERILSLSFWRDEAAVSAWRKTQEHRHAQALGRTGVFSTYRLRVAHVVRDYGLHTRAEAPEDSKNFHSHVEQ